MALLVGSFVFGIIEIRMSSKIPVEKPPSRAKKIRIDVIPPEWKQYLEH